MIAQFRSVFFSTAWSPSSGQVDLLALRVAVGLMMAWNHGLPKLLAAPGYFLRGESWRDVDLVVGLGLPFPRVMATLAGLIQFFGALAVAVGFYARLNACIILSTLAVAVYWNFMQGKDNQMALLYAGMFFAVILAGSDRFSLAPKPKAG